MWTPPFRPNALFSWITDHNINRIPRTTWGCFWNVLAKVAGISSLFPFSLPPIPILPSPLIYLWNNYSKCLQSIRSINRYFFFAVTSFKIYLYILCVWCFVCMYAYQKRALDPMALPYRLYRVLYSYHLYRLHRQLDAVTVVSCCVGSGKWTKDLW